VNENRRHLASFTCAKRAKVRNFLRSLLQYWDAECFGLAGRGRRGYDHVAALKYFLDCLFLKCVKSIDLFCPEHVDYRFIHRQLFNIRPKLWRRLVYSLQINYIILRGAKDILQKRIATGACRSQKRVYLLGRPDYLFLLHQELQVVSLRNSAAAFVSVKEVKVCFVNAAARLRDYRAYLAF